MLIGTAGIRKSKKGKCNCGEQNRHNKTELLVFKAAAADLESTSERQSGFD